MVLSICEWGSNKPWRWGKDIGHLWRTTGDITNCFDCVVDHGSWNSWGIMQILDMQDGLREYAGPGHWNDPDMMEVGNDLTDGENRAHFSMWSLLAAPLIAGNDLRNMSESTRVVLTNPEVIAVNQDPLGIQGLRASREDSVEIWFKPLVNGDWAVGVLNRAQQPRTVEIDWPRSEVNDDFSRRDTDFANVAYSIRNLWTHQASGTTQTVLSEEVPPRDILMLRLTPTQ